RRVGGAGAVTVRGFSGHGVGPRWGPRLSSRRALRPECAPARLRDGPSNPAPHRLANDCGNGYAVQPPSTTSTEPVTNDAASDARYSAAPAISSGCAWRASAV